MFDEALKCVKDKNAKKYASILKAGNALMDDLFHLFKSVWNKQTIPEKWEDTNIV